MKAAERRLKNGTKCYIIKKQGFKVKQAMLSVNFGSGDRDGTDGKAHFLEHKAFEQRNRDVFREFSLNNADVNAFTNINTTAYYFNCTDNFESNLKTLLEFTSNPCFTEKSVENEKSIIGEEIKMYEDDCFWRVYFNLLGAMYGNCPLKNSIAGSMEDLREINAKALMELYNKYYCGKNSALVICGDVEPEKCFQLAEEFCGLKQGEEIKRKPFEGNALKHFCTINMDVTVPVFNIGFKESKIEGSGAYRLCAGRILLDLICGKTSELYEKLYEKGLIDRELGSEYSFGRNYGFSIISGKSRNAGNVAECVLSRIREIKRRGIDAKEFERSRNRLLGMFVANGDNLDSLTAMLTDYAFKDVSLDGVFDEFCRIKISDVMNRIDMFDEKNMTLSLAEQEK